MTTYLLGVTQTYVDTGGILGGGTTRPLQGLRDARVKVVLDQYAMSSSVASGAIIKLFGALPAGANVLFFHLSASVAQASLTFNLGDLASATRYASAASGLQSALPTVTLVGGAQYVIGTATNDSQIILTTGGATGTSGTLYACIYYTTD